jgi:hypothetical protein
VPVASASCALIVTVLPANTLVALVVVTTYLAATGGTGMIGAWPLIV